MTKITVAAVEPGTRLDTYLATRRPELSRSSWKKLIESSQVFVNSQTAKAKIILAENDIIEYTLPKKQIATFKLDVIYEDSDVVVVNKPYGLLVHAKGGIQPEQTLVDILKDKLPDDGTNRPGIVHRLDRDTSGVMICAKNSHTKTYLQKQFQNRSVFKEYRAVVEGVFKEEEFLIDAPLRRSIKKPGRFEVNSKGKPAQTTVRVIETKNSKSLVSLQPKTGRTHQLRVHLSYLGHPIVGDRLYGEENNRLMLHAFQLKLAIAHDNFKAFAAPPPKEFKL